MLFLQNDAGFDDAPSRQPRDTRPHSQEREVKQTDLFLQLQVWESCKKYVFNFQPVGSRDHSRGRHDTDG